MNQRILLCNMPDKERRLTLELILFPLGIPLVYIEKEDYLKPLGYFSGDDYLSPPVSSSYQGPELADELLLFSHLPENMLQPILGAIRNSSLKSIPHKAVITPTNVNWNVLQVFEEIHREYKALQP